MVEKDETYSDAKEEGSACYPKVEWQNHEILFLGMVEEIEDRKTFVQ